FLVAVASKVVGNERSVGRSGAAAAYNLVLPRPEVRGYPTYDAADRGAPPRTRSCCRPAAHRDLGTHGSPLRGGHSDHPPSGLISICCASGGHRGGSQGPRGQSEAARTSDKGLS